MSNRQNQNLRLGYLVHDVSRLRRMMLDRALAPLGITRSQWWVLAFVSRKNGLPQSQLADELDVGKVALGALVDRLESAGLVARKADAEDRRVKRVFLTALAKPILDRIRAEIDVVNVKITKSIDRQDLEKLSNTLRAMKNNLLSWSEDWSEAARERKDDAAPMRRASKVSPAS